MAGRDCDVTGQGVRAIADAAARHLLLDAEVFQTGHIPLFPSAENVGNDVWVAYQGNDDNAYLLKRSVGVPVLLGKTAAPYATLVTRQGDVYWVDRDCAHYWKLGDPARKTIPGGTTTRGFAYPTADGQPVWAHLTLPIVVQDVKIYAPYVDGAWTFGMHQNNRILATRNGVLYDCGAVGNSPPKGRQLPDGSGIVAVNRYGVFRTSDQFTVIPPEPEPPDPMPMPIPTSCRFHPCGMDGWKSSTSECHFLDGTIKWGGLAYDARLVNEGQPWAKPYGGQLWSVWCSTERQPDEYPTHTAYVKDSIALAKAQKRALLVVSDDPEWTSKAQAIETAAKSAGVKSARGLEAYPFPGETTDDSDERMERLVRAAKTAKKQVVVISRVDWAGCLALAPRLHKLIDQKFPSTIAGHLVFGTFRSNSDESIDTMKWWEKTWALMPSGVIIPL